MRGIKRKMVFFVTLFFISGVALGFFGMNDALLGKILVEDIQQTLSLTHIVNFAAGQLKNLNDQYGFERWVNKGLNDVKDYGFLNNLRVDDFVLGTFQKDIGEVGAGFGGQMYSLKNINQWIDQIWDTMPEEIHSRADIRSAVVHGNAVRAYQQYLSNVERNQKIKAQFDEMMSDASQANPGAAARLSAQANVIQTAQLANIDDTQSNILKMIAINELEKQEEINNKRVNLKQGFVGVIDIMKTVPTLGK